MTKAKILIVEDEAIVTRDVRNRLEKLGYMAVGTTHRGDRAVLLAEELCPDVVLMDIHLQGEMDGIEAGAAIRSRFGLPVVFATANADASTLNRALLAEPFGYILKPFEDRELQTAIEMALYKSRSDRQLRDSEANKAAIMNSAMDCIITMDASGRITEFNPAAERTFRRARGDVLGKSLPELLLPEWSRKHFESEIAKCQPAYIGSVRGQRTELTAQRADGTEFPAEWSVSTTKCECQTVVICFCRDLSASRLLEQQMRQAQKMQAVGALAGGIAHDFNNLLTIINGHTEALFTGLRADYRACARVQEIAKAGDRAARLTRQLLAFSRQQVFKPRVLNINDLVIDFQRMLNRLFGEEVVLTTNIDPDLGQVKVDPGQIEQVLMNLAVNARDAMPSGGRLTIETMNAELDDAYARLRPEAKPGHYAVLAVSDSGYGMSKETLSRIFEPFFTTKEAGHGAGLGLATAYGIVKQSGGFIYAYSEPGHGSCFKVYLPLSGERLTPIFPESSESAPTGEVRGTVLLVEDEDGVRTLLRPVLEEKGYAVLEAANGKEALAVADQFGQPIDLLLTDVVMPEMGGRVLAEKFAASHPETKVIFMSGYTDDVIVRQGVLEADVEFLQKPYTMAALLNKIRTVLDGNKANNGRPQIQEAVAALV